MNDASAGAPSLGDAAILARASWSQHLARIGPLALAAWSAVALGVALRLFALPNEPLWLDETWTGAIIAGDSLGAVLRRSLFDANAPLYFALLHGWSSPFGLSNGALRFPSLLFGALAPLLALIPLKGMPRDARFLWCAVLALWFPGIAFSQEARCYAMLLFLTTACTVAYVHLLQRPDLRRASLWALIGSLCILTHYHALVLLGLQGLAYLALHGRRALRTWPAALLFAPAFAWSFVHLPHVAQFADPEFAWFDRLRVDGIPQVLVFLFGSIAAAIGVTTLVMIPLIIGSAREAATAGAPNVPVRAAVATAALGAAIVLGAAMLSTSFTDRYLVPFVPGLLLGLVMIALRLGRRWTLVPIGLVLVFGASAVSMAVNEGRRIQKIYNFQIASEALMAANVHDLVFLWDNPSSPVFPPEMLAKLGGFFFNRAGWPAAVTGLTLRPGEDPNERLVAAASGRPERGILWIYDLEVRGTAAKSYPPRIEQNDSAWQCRQFGRGRIGILACNPR